MHEEKKTNLFEKTISKWLTQKTEIFKTTNSQKRFVKISEIVPWVSRID
jgi:hypothetical protein